MVIVLETKPNAARRTPASTTSPPAVRRGIATASIATEELIGVTGQLETIAQDEGADVIVAGGDGHTRFSEWVFGGVTRELLEARQALRLADRHQSASRSRGIRFPVRPRGERGSSLRASRPGFPLSRE